MSRSRNYIFTINYASAQSVEDIPKLNVDIDAQNIKFMAYQLEKVETFHYQGLILFYNPRVITGVKKALGSLGAHIEIMRGTLEQAYAYATKEETRVAPPIELGQKPAFKAGARTDLEEVRDEIIGGKRLDDILLDYPSISSRNLKWIQTIFALQLKRKARQRYLDTKEKKVIVYWGPSGSGKTSRVYKENDLDNIYKLTFGDGTSNSLWFDDYQSEEVLLLDDFYGNIKYSYMLRLLDIYPLRVQCKGSYTYVNFTKIYITSNSAPEDWYNCDVITDISALERRITKVREIIPETQNKTFHLSYTDGIVFED